MEESEPRSAFGPRQVTSPCSDLFAYCGVPKAEDVACRVKVKGLLSPTSARYETLLISLVNMRSRRVTFVSRILALQNGVPCCWPTLE